MMSQIIDLLKELKQFKKVKCGYRLLQGMMSQIIDLLKELNQFKNITLVLKLKDKDERMKLVAEFDLELQAERYNIHRYKKIK